MIKYISVVLCIFLALLEYRFWFSNDSILQVAKLKRTIAAQQKENDALKIRNNEITQQINNLKQYPQAIEEHARYELGLVKQGEKYYQVVEPLE
jgi:cell division protein FtsB